jgi:hypothetical protein
MSNALQRDRYTVWQATPGASFAFDIDMGADFSIDTFGLHRLALTGSTALTNVQLHYTTSAHGYDGGALSATPPNWTSGGALTLPAQPWSRRDFFISFAPVVARYWRMDFNFSVAGTFSLGKLLFGAKSDLGIVAQAGTKWTIARPRVTLPTPTGENVVLEFGAKSWTYSARIEKITQSLRDGLLALELNPQTDSFAILDPEDNLLEMRLVDGTIGWEHMFTGVYAVQLDMVSLP